MSSHKYYLVITDESKEDFRDILSFTRRMWGDQQVDKYGDLLHNALRAIELNPEIGKADLPPYCYVRAGQHYVFYKLDGDMISVFRILHSKMDFTRHLK